MNEEGNLIRRPSKPLPEAFRRPEPEETNASQLETLAYALEQYSAAIRSLTGGHGKLNQRLQRAWVESIMHVRPDGLPESMRRATEYIMESLRDPAADEEQQTNLAAEIVAIYTEIVQALEREKMRSGSR